MFGVIAMGSLGFAVYLRLQPPTVIRVDKDGEAVVVKPTSKPNSLARLSFETSAANEVAPTEVEAKAVVRRFLKHYLNYDPGSVDRNFSEALNMMTSNLRRYTLNKLRDQDVVGKIK